MATQKPFQQAEKNTPLIALIIRNGMCTFRQTPHDNSTSDKYTLAGCVACVIGDRIGRLTDVEDDPGSDD